jgi:predicted permease
LEKRYEEKNDNVWKNLLKGLGNFTTPHMMFVFVKHARSQEDRTLASVQPICIYLFGALAIPYFQIIHYLTTSLHKL